MEYERKFYPGGSNGMSSAHEAQQKKHNYKLIIDPMIHQRGGQKIYRFDGIDPADNTIISVKDPRPRYLRFWSKKIPADLPVPKFKFDEHFVGLPPPNEVTFTNLNDNINKDFLENMCKGFGKIEESKIYYNPKTKKHMSIGKVLFTSSKSAKACANKLNQTSKMGNIMNVFVDSLGEKRQKIIDEILDDRPKTTKPPSPKLDPRSGRPFDLAAALHIDHDPPAHQNTLPDMYNTSSGGIGEHAGLGKGPNHHNNLYIPLEQTPSDFSYSSNHSDPGYLSATPASSYHGDNNFGRNQFNNSNNNQFGANYGHGNGGGYNNRNQIPPPQSPFVKSSAGFGNTPSTGFGGTPSGSSFGGTPMSYDSSVPKTPITPQTPQAPPPMNDVKNDRYGGYDNRDRGGRNFQNRDKRDRGRDSYNRDRNKDSDWNRSRNNDWNKSDKYSSRDSRDKNKRDWRNERDDWGNRDRNRYNRDKDRSSRNDYRDYREEEPPPPRPKVMEHKPAFPPQEEVYTPEVYKPEVYKPEVFTPTVPPPAFTPQPPEVIKEEEEPRSMSLDSRIQSLLSGFKSPEPKPKEEPTPKVIPTHPPVLPSTPAVSVHDDQAQFSNPSVDTSGSSNSQQWSTQNAYTNGSSAVTPAQDDDDRMSLDSAGSAGEQGAIEINPADTSVPPPPLPSQIPSEFPNPVSQVSNWQQQNDIANSYMSGFVNTYNSGGRFNQNYINQFNNNLNNQNFDVPKEEEEEKNDPDIHEATFNTALEDFVKELKEIMTKDLCKKMVENSAFKSYERWWDKESGKNKPQKLLPEKTRPSEVAKSVPIAKPAEVSSALAGLFSQSDRPRHPWSKEGEFNIGAAYGGSMGIGGGFLGIRTGMPRMPSFKKKVPPKSEEEIEREEKRERRDKERRERKEKKKREKEKEDQKKQESESEKDDIVVSEEGSKRKPIFSDSESEGEDKEEGDSEGESEAATSSSDEESSDSDDSNDDDDDDDDDESGSSSSEAESSESSSSDEEGEETKSETKADKKDDSDNEPVKIVSSSSSSSSDTSSSESESSSSEDEEEEEGAAVEKQIEEKEDGEITTESEVDKQDEEAEKMEVEDEKSLEKIIREKTPDQQSSRSNTPIDVETPMSTENKMDVEEPTDECIEKLAEMLKQKPVNKKTQKKSPGRPKKSQPQTPPVVDNNQQQNLFDKFNPQSDNTLSGLSLLSEAASMSLRELVQQPSLARTMEDKAAQEEAERSEWLENRPSFLSEHAYYARPANADDKDSNATLSAGEDEIVDDDLKNHRLIWIDHNYCLTPSPQLMADMQKEYEQTLQLAKDIEEQNARQQAEIERTEKLKEVLSPEKPKKGRKRKITNEALTDITNNKISTKPKEKGNRELANLLEPVKPKEVVKFKARTLDEERQMFFNMFNKGIDAEDINYLMKSYENLLQTDDPMFYWLNDILWVDHAVTNIPDPVPPKRKRKGDAEIVTTKHKTGCARTEGYYKLSMKEKAAYLQHAYNQQKAAEKAKQVEEIGSKSHKLQTTTVRELRHENRRLQTSLQDLDLGDLFKFNQLKFRKKQLKFGRSSIHSWGLFALEPIATDEMVIEYVGTGLRQSVADLREKQYEAKGIGSSYLFRVDGETIIDATKTGNLARFINHSCNPNCYAKVITVDGQKKIVIYSRRDIDVNEEITYDYKFPIEDDKITCFCGASNCRGFLN